MGALASGVCGGAGQGAGCASGLVVAKRQIVLLEYISAFKDARLVHACEPPELHLGILGELLNSHDPGVGKNVLGVSRETLGGDAVFVDRATFGHGAFVGVRSVIGQEPEHHGELVDVFHDVIELDALQKPGELRSGISELLGVTRIELDADFHLLYFPSLLGWVQNVQYNNYIKLTILATPGRSAVKALSIEWFTLLWNADSLTLSNTSY